MTVPAAVTNLRTSPDAQNGNVVVTWTQATHFLPDEGITQNKIEVSLDDGVTWVTHYDTAAFTGRRLWELCVAQRYWLRVSAKNASGWGPTNTIVGEPLGYCGGTMPMWLTSTEDHTLSVPWGATENEDQGWVSLANPTNLNRAGQKHYRTLFDAVDSFQYDFDIALPATLRLNRSGDTLTALNCVSMLRQMFSNRDLLIARDDDGDVHYCKMTVFNGPHRLHGIMRRVQGTLLAQDAPTYPFTTAI